MYLALKKKSKKGQPEKIAKKCALQHTKSAKESFEAKALKISKPLLH